MSASTVPTLTFLREMPSVVIIGSGLVGAATALALHQAGIQSTLYDQAQPTEPVMDGYPVEFGETG
ncbi:hypothetical protein HDU99_004420, partial [Rhizoclosmatium hyalinum]